MARRGPATPAEAHIQVILVSGGLVYQLQDSFAFHLFSSEPRFLEGWLVRGSQCLEGGYGRFS